MPAATLDAHIPFETTTFAYYKGTRPVPLPPKAVNSVLKSGVDAMLNNFRQEHMSDKKIIPLLKKQLDDWEDQLCEHQRFNPEKTGHESTADEWLGAAWGADWPQKLLCWYLNIGALLRLKAIKNDNMNGWLVVKR